jgi:hypothetical protein
MRINTCCEVAVAAGHLGIAALLGSILTVATGTLADTSHESARTVALAPQGMAHCPSLGSCRRADPDGSARGGRIIASAHARVLGYTSNAHRTFS